MVKQNEAVAKGSLGQFGRSFQEQIVKALLVDKQWAEQMADVLRPEYFDLDHLSFLAERYLAYARTYRAYPSLQLLVTIVKDELKSTLDANLKNSVIDFVQRIRLDEDLDDSHYVKERSLDWCKRQALKGALSQAIDLVEKEKYDSIVDVVKEAVLAGTESSLGHDYMQDIESRYVALKRDCVPTGIPELDASGILNGGLGKGELCIVAAASGVGKSHFLTALGANAMREGKRVLHYTFELSAEQVGLRYDSNLCNIDSNDLLNHKELVSEMLKGLNLGRLQIKYWPTNTATITTLRAHIEKLAIKGFRPDLLIIDYADIMRSSRAYDSLRHELNLIYRELKGLAGELGIPIATASQVNRDGAEVEVVDMTKMSEAFGKVFVADVVLTLSRRAAEKASGHARLYVAKNRAGRDGIVYNVHVNTARSTFEITGTGELEQAQFEDKKEVHEALVAKWKAFGSGK